MEKLSRFPMWDASCVSLVNYPQAHCFGPVRETLTEAARPDQAPQKPFAWVVLRQEIQGKEHITNKPPPTGRIWEGQKEIGDTSVCPPRILHWNPSWLSGGAHYQQGPWGEWLARGDSEANPITWTQGCKPHDRAVLLGSLTLLLSAQMPHANQAPCFVSTRVSLDNSFPSVR